MNRGSEYISWALADTHLHASDPSELPEPIQKAYEGTAMRTHKVHFWSEIKPNINSPLLHLALFCV